MSRRKGRPYTPKPLPAVPVDHMRDAFNESVFEFERMTDRLYGGLIGGGGIGGVSGGWWGPYKGLMAIPAVNRCVRLITGALINSPLYQFRDVQGGLQPAQRVFPTPGYLSNPAQGVDTRATVIGAWGIDFLLGGDAIGIVAGRNADGTPTGFFPVAANMVQVAFLNGSVGTTFTNIYDSVESGQPDQIVYRIGSLMVDSSNVLHVKNLNGPGSLRGAGVLETALQTFETARELNRTAADMHRNGVPTGVLAATSPDVTRQQLIDAKADWLRKQRVSEIAVLAPGVTFTPLSWNPEERQLMEARRYSDIQVAQLFGVPLGFLAQGVGGLTYSTPTLDSQAFRQFTMNDIYERFEEAFSQLMPRGNSARFDRDKIDIQEPGDRISFVTTALSAGLMTHNEGRSYLGLPSDIETTEEVGLSNPKLVTGVLGALTAGVILPSEARDLLGLPALPEIDAEGTALGTTQDDEEPAPSNQDTVVTDQPDADLPDDGSEQGADGPGSFDGDAQPDASNGVRI